MDESHRTELLQTFQLISGISDLPLALNMMHQADWDLQRALSTANSSGMQQQQQHREPHVSGLGSSTTANMNGSVNAVNTNAAMNESREGWLSWSLRALLGLRPRRRNSDEVSPDSRDDEIVPHIERFVRDFEGMFGSTFPTPMLCAFAKAVQRAKADFKFLIVYLHCDIHEDTDQFCRETLCDLALKEFVDDNFCFWMGTVANADGLDVSNALQASTYPFLAVIATYGTNMTVVDTHGGSISAQDTIAWLTSLLEQHGPELIADRNEAQSRQADRRLREEQDMAYEESLLQDQLKVQRENQVREERMEMEREQQRLQQHEQQKKLQAAQAQAQRQQKRQRRKEAAEQLIPDEPKEAQGVTNIAIKMPDGTRLQRKFRLSDSLDGLYAFVEAQDHITEDFVLSKHFPKKILHRQSGVTLSDVGLTAQEMLFVESVDEEE